MTNRELKTYERFKEFHTANPGVYQLFIQFARSAKSRRDRFGARMIWERMRWYTAIETTGDDLYKLNNSFVSYYGRMLMLDMPDEFGGFFSVRYSRSDATDRQIQNDLIEACAVL